MKIHRFYVPEEVVSLVHDFWLHDTGLLWQWNKVLRFRAGHELVLFDGRGHDSLYRLEELKPDEAHLVHITDFRPVVPARNTYLLWALLKKDKNDWVLQKCTELGVSHFIPLIAERSEKTGFNAERARKIVIEAAEQCGRSDIPLLREPMHVRNALEQLQDKVTLMVCDQGNETLPRIAKDAKLGLLVGPEGGWSEVEQGLFKERALAHIGLHEFTLRAETAAVTAVAYVMHPAAV